MREFRIVPPPLRGEEEKSLTDDIFSMKFKRELDSSSFYRDYLFIGDIETTSAFDLKIARIKIKNKHDNQIGVVVYWSYPDGRYELSNHFGDLD